MLSFLLTHPVWDVTDKHYNLANNNKFLLTHPVWDVTVVCLILKHHLSISTHTSRVGCDRTGTNIPLNPAIFLLTHPVWDVTAIYSILQSQHPHISRDGLIIHLELY